jgi:DNA-binding MarR family transcriptional regulator
MSPPYEAPEAPPEVEAIARYNDLVARNLRNTQVLEGLVESAGARITRATFEVLANIERRGPLRLSNLVQRMGVDQSTISRQIRPLEELGLIARSEDPDDRRAVWLSTTEVGQAVILRVRKRVNRNVEAALASWSSDDRADLGRLLDKFRASVIELAMSAGFEDAVQVDPDADPVDAAADADSDSDSDQARRAGNGSGAATATGRTVRDSKPAKAQATKATKAADANKAAEATQATKAVKAAGAGGRTGDGARPPRGGGPRRVRGTGGAS